MDNCIASGLRRHHALPRSAPTASRRWCDKADRQGHSGHRLSPTASTSRLASAHATGKLSSTSASLTTASMCSITREHEVGRRLVGFFPGPQGANFSDDAVQGFRRGDQGQSYVKVAVTRRGDASLNVQLASRAERHAGLSGHQLHRRDRSGRARRGHCSAQQPDARQGEGDRHQLYPGRSIRTFRKATPRAQASTSRRSRRSLPSTWRSACWRSNRCRQSSLVPRQHSSPSRISPVLSGTRCSHPRTTRLPTRSTLNDAGGGARHAARRRRFAEGDYGRASADFRFSRTSALNFVAAKFMSFSARTGRGNQPSLT